jgi:hypothetical protein
MFRALHAHSHDVLNERNLVFGVHVTVHRRHSER